MELTTTGVPKIVYIHTEMEVDGDVAIKANDYILAWLTTDGNFVLRYLDGEEKEALLAMGFRFSTHKIEVG